MGNWVPLKYHIVTGFNVHLTTDFATQYVSEPEVLPYCCQVFIVDIRANKKQIKDAVARLYDIQTKKINTLIR